MLSVHLVLVTLHGQFTMSSIGDTQCNIWGSAMLI